MPNDFGLDLDSGLSFLTDRRNYQEKRPPIIRSLLDVDFYKFTMGQLIYHQYADVPVTFEFINRTKGVRLADSVDENYLREELDHVRDLRFNKTELHYLRGTDEYSKRMFDERYLKFLEQLQLPPYRLEKVDGNYKLEFPGRWSEATYWETIALAIISELHYRSFMKRLSDFQRDAVYATGISRLAKKIEILKTRPDVTFIDFGTRRRFSRDWQDYVVRVLASEFPKEQFRGTSNTYLAMKYWLLPMGTYAHELEMGLSGIMHGSDDEIRASHSKVLQDWWEEYGRPLSVALIDTYGSDFFFRTMTPQQARKWKGLRVDSGDDSEVGEKAIAFYKRCDVDPRKKFLIYSDGLDVERMLKIADYFAGRIPVTFGPGTNMTNDLGPPPLSLIVKLMKSNGHDAVKLSDNLAKALGNPKVVERFKRIFGYTVSAYKEVRY